MTGTAELNATARVRQLIDLTERLIASLGAEAKAFEAHRPQVDEHAVLERGVERELDDAARGKVDLRPEQR